MKRALKDSLFYGGHSLQKRTLSGRRTLSTEEDTLYRGGHSPQRRTLSTEVKSYGFRVTGLAIRPFKGAL